MPSTVIRSYAYLPAERALEINFTTGRRYVYHDVPPAAFSAFASAFSKGRHFNRHIRDRYAFSEGVAGQLNGA